MATKHVIVGAGAGASLMAIVLQVAVPNIQGFEGTKLQAYHDVANILTVCTGHTGPDVVVGKVYTQDQCNALTNQDAEKAASGVLKVSPQLIYHPIVLASAVSFSYNVGVGTYDKSSVAANFNAGNLVAGCNAMLKYTFADGKYSQGLANRRKAENTICLSTLTPKGLTDVGTASKPAP